MSERTALLSTADDTLLHQLRRVAGESPDRLCILDTDGGAVISIPGTEKADPDDVRVKGRGHKV